MRIITGFILLFITAPVFAQLKVDHLLTENLINPEGIDAVQPRFSWQLISRAKNVLQTAYEIKVSDSKNILWNSGKVNSDSSVFVHYKGEKLGAGNKYSWQVRVWDNQQHISAWSTPAYFRMGLQPGDWKAKWIGPGYVEDPAMRPCPVLQKAFTLGKKIKSAVAFVTAHGMYEAQINGKRLGDAYFTPGWTSYAKRLQYQVYDMTDLLKQGANNIQVLLGDGWYRGSLGFEGTKMKETYGNTVDLLFQLQLEYADGTKELIISDKDWQSATGPVRYSDIYQGEKYDARTSIGEWVPVKIFDYGYANLIATENEPVKKREVLPPLKIFTTPSGERVVDFGQNLVGFVRLAVQGKAGDSIILDHGEALDKNGNFYNGNLRSAKQQNMYILKGGEKEIFEPHFTWQGFRYVRIKGSVDITAGQLEAIVLYSAMPQSGMFECSNTLINRLQQNIVWSQRGNFVDIPTDCPQRDERMGWLGDAQLFSRTAAFNYHVLPFFTKWLKDLSADQLKSGAVPVVIPNILGGFGGAAGWSDASTIIPWNLYTLYGDKQVLINQYPSMKAWVNFQEKNSANYLRNPAFQFGDWLSYAVNGPADPNRSAVTDMDMLAQIFYIRSVQIMLSSARVLDKQEDIHYYSTLLNNINQAFLKEYVTPGGRIMSNTQTAYTLALAFDILPESMRADAAAKLVANIKSYENHITTGLVGTPFICHVLSRFGYTDVAYQLLLQETYPSWLYPVKMGATTIWERWDGIKPDGSFQHPTMNSFNHYAYGAIGDWLYRVMAGINSDTTGVGYKKIIIQPRPGGNLTYVNASLETYYGQIISNWKIVNGKFMLDVTVPANTTADIILPDGKRHSVGSGHYHFTSN